MRVTVGTVKPLLARRMLSKYICESRILSFHRCRISERAHFKDGRMKSTGWNVGDGRRAAVVMKRFGGAVAVMLTVLLGLSVPSAHAVLFDFNALADGASNAAVQAYMQGALTSQHSSGVVTVSGSAAERDYTGDNHVVGPVSGRQVTPLTLGNTNGGTFHSGGFESYLINRTDSTTISMLFSVPIYTASFDYEIFPDGTCPTPGCNPGSWPDFTFKADNVVEFRTLGVIPGAGGTYPHSPASGIGSTEAAPQFLGESGTWNFPNGVTKLEFVDWPRRIGIDNLYVGDNRQPDPLPEPSSFVLLASGLLGAWGALGISRRRRNG